MPEPFFSDIERIPYEGPDSENDLAFRYYDPDRLVLGKRMQDHLRVAVCYWHSFCWPGSDVFGDGSFDRPWLATDGEALAQAEHKTDVAFEFFSKLGVPFFCFHDLDVAPEGASFRESCDNLDRIVDTLKEANADLVLLKEVDFDSDRSYRIDQATYVAENAC